MSSVSVFERLIRFSQSAVLGGVVLVITNLIPLVGVLWWGWDAFVIVFLYWLENGVVGVVTFLRIRKVEQQQNTSGLTTSGFFVMHYGIFFAVHGIFVMLLPAFAGGTFALPKISPLGVLFAIVALSVSHAANYVFVFLRHREYLHTQPMREMWRPYPRLFTLHFVIVFGAVLAGILGQPVALVVLLVLFKTAFELGLFLLDRRLRIASGATAVPGATGRR
jgi:hypothetical protein